MVTNLQVRKKFQTQLLISTVASSIYLLFTLMLALLAWTEIQICRDSTHALMETVHNADADFIGGYAVAGGLIGAGAVTLFEFALSLILLVTIIYMIMLAAENISGYRLYYKLKKNEYGPKLRKRIRRNAIFRIVVAIFVIIPLACFLFHSQFFALVLGIIPQLIILVWSINALRKLSAIAFSIEEDVLTAE